VTAPTVDRDQQDRKRDQQCEQLKPSQPQVERKRALHTSSSERNRVKKELQRRQRTARENQKRARVIEQQRTTAVEPVRRDREQRRVESQHRIEQKQKVRPQQRIEQSNQARKQVRDKGKEQENVFARVDDGNKALSASERGRSSRQGRSNEPAKSRGFWSKPGTNW